MSLRVVTAGVPQVFRHGNEIEGFSSRTRRFALLAYIAVERDVTRDGVTGVFWPESDTKHARAALSQALLEINRSVGDGWLVRDGEFLRATDALTCDAREALQAIDQELWQEGLSKLDGEFLAGTWVPTTQFEAWVDRKRSTLARARKRAHEAVVRIRTSRGDAEKALEAALAWVSDDALDDDAQHTLIQILGAAGRRADAIRQFEEYERLLRSELDVEPLDRTKELVANLRSAGARVGQRHVRGPATPRDVSSSGLGRATLAVGNDLQILRLLGTGSMASVYLAREPGLRRLVAVKVLHPELAHNELAGARFLREAQAAARILHPNVVTVYRVGSLSDGSPCLVMPFIDGVSLSRRMESEGSIPADEVTRIVFEIASALAAAHAENVLHRDVRPGNILIEQRSGRAYLADFGIAGVLETGDPAVERFTRTHEVLGQMEFMSPEHANGDPLSDRSDIYCLGVTALALLNGARRGDLVGELALNRAVERARRVAAGLVPLLERCIRAAPNQRPSAHELIRSLERLERDSGATDRSHGRIHRRYGGWTPLRIIGLALVLGGLVAALIWF